MKKRSLLCLMLSGSLVLCSCSKTIQEAPVQSQPDSSQAVTATADSADEASTKAVTEDAVDVDTLSRTSLLGEEVIYYNEDLVPSVPAYEVASDFSNVYINPNLEYYFSGEYEAYAEFSEKLLENYFFVNDNSMSEFFEIYEDNRYFMTPSFVTVDSLMHTYHLYFAYLLKTTEKNYLKDTLEELTGKMLENSVNQYEALKGSEWESAALRNVAYFDVAAQLLEIDDSVAKSVSEIESDVQTELDRINSAEGIETSLISGVNEDYSQYTVRGYYENEEALQGYFKAMMWYGRMAFVADSEEMCRSALLMNLSVYEAGETLWDQIYRVTAFFAGASDDNGYYEYMPVITSCYGSIPQASDLAGNSSAFDAYFAQIKELDTPAINSIAVEDGDSNVIPSFRFMGQRFTIDEAIFQQLVYSNVKENSEGEKRMLPDVLDVPAALGSEVAYEILDAQGDTDYEGYTESLSDLQEEFNNADPELWNASLYSSWLYTLRPLLDQKGDGYPSYMTTDEWAKKNLETFAGSYAELKHDTILYTKQMMAEMGGGDEEPDDKGYVDPQPVVYSRFINLANNTRDGLDSFGMLSSEDKENLNLLSEMAMELLTISEKELVCENLTDEEYDFIRDFGGNLEHFWILANQDNAGDEPMTAAEAPCPVVADIATDPNGSILEVGTGYAHKIYVIVPVEGELRIATGSVYSFYQFESTERLTDSEWRNQISSYYFDEDYNYIENENVIEQPEWTQSYRATAHWDY